MPNNNIDSLETVMRYEGPTHSRGPSGISARLDALEKNTRDLVGGAQTLRERLDGLKVGVSAEAARRSGPAPGQVGAGAPSVDALDRAFSRDLADLVPRQDAKDEHADAQASMVAKQRDAWKPKAKADRKEKSGGGAAPGIVGHTAAGNEPGDFDETETDDAETAMVTRQRDAWKPKRASK